MENWQSEYLQFTLFILLTVWLLQRGSPESKELHKGGRESDEEQKAGEHADERSPRWARLTGISRPVYEKLRGGDIIVRTNPQFCEPDGSPAEVVEARRRETFPADHPATWITQWSPSEGSP